MHQAYCILANCPIQLTTLGVTGAALGAHNTIQQNKIIDANQEMSKIITKYIIKA